MTPTTSSTTAAWRAKIAIRGGILLLVAILLGTSGFQDFVSELPTVTGMNGVESGWRKHGCEWLRRQDSSDNNGCEIPCSRRQRQRRWQQDSNDKQHVDDDDHISPIVVTPDFPCFQGCRCPAPFCVLEPVVSKQHASFFTSDEITTLPSSSKQQQVACVNSPYFTATTAAGRRGAGAIEIEDELVCVGGEVPDSIPPPFHQTFNSATASSLEFARAQLQRFKRATSWGFRRWFDWGEGVPYGGARRGPILERDAERILKSLREQEQRERQEELRRNGGATTTGNSGGRARRRLQQKRNQNIRRNFENPRFVPPKNGGRASGAHDPADGVYRARNVCFYSEGSAIAGFFPEQQQQQQQQQPSMELYRGTEEFQPMAGSQQRMQGFQHFISSGVERLPAPPEFVLEMNVLVVPVQWKAEEPQHFLYRAMAARNIAKSIWGAEPRFHVVFVVLPSAYLDVSLSSSAAPEPPATSQETRSSNSSSNETAVPPSGDDEDVEHALSMIKRLHIDQKATTTTTTTVAPRPTRNNSDKSAERKSTKPPSTSSATTKQAAANKSKKKQDTATTKEPDRFIAALEGAKRFYQMLGQSWSTVWVAPPPSQPSSSSASNGNKTKPTKKSRIPLALRQALHASGIPVSAEQLAQEIESSSSSSLFGFPSVCFAEVVLSQVCLGACSARGRVGNQFHSPPMLFPRNDDDAHTLRRFRRELESCLHKPPRVVANGWSPTVTVVMSPHAVSLGATATRSPNSSSGSISLFSFASSASRYRNPIDFGLACAVPAIRKQLDDMGLKSNARLHVVTPQSLTPNQLMHLLIDTDILIGSSLAASAAVLSLAWLLPPHGVVVEIVSPQRLLPFSVDVSHSAASASSSSSSSSTTNEAATKAMHLLPARKHSASWRDETCLYGRKSGWNRLLKCDIGGNAVAAGLNHFALLLPSNAVAQLQQRQQQQVQSQQKSRQQRGKHEEDESEGGDGDEQSSYRAVVVDAEGANRNKRSAPISFILPSSSSSKSRDAAPGSSTKSLSHHDDVPLGIFVGPAVYAQLTRHALCRLIVATRVFPIHGGRTPGSGEKHHHHEKNPVHNSAGFTALRSDLFFYSRDDTTTACRKIQFRAVRWNFTEWKFGFDS